MLIEHLLCARNAIREQENRGAAPHDGALPEDTEPQSIGCRAGLQTAQEAPGAKRRTPWRRGGKRAQVDTAAEAAEGASQVQRARMLPVRPIIS